MTFLGREIDHRPWILSAAVGDVVPTFVDHPAGAAPDDLLDAVRATTPDAIVAFTPGDVPADALAETGALTLAVVTATFAPGVDDVWHVHSDLPAAPALPQGYDRVLTTDPLLARAAGAWRSAPLPVDDARFADAPSAGHELRAVFAGEHTPWRGYWLDEASEHYGLRHLSGAEIGGEEFRDATVGLCLREAREQPAFPATALLHLAAGHLLITEPLRPARGLEPGLDHLEVREPIELMHLLHQVRKRPAAFEHIRLRGRARMELFRASAVWPRVLADLAADVAAYGRPAGAGVV
ncbi:MAG: hypothetical protein JWQ20_2508 [Conexibacter sp.]|nr:hypothetical protein [Conexibacter sp.]